jgi:hypothetical protein
MQSKTAETFHEKNLIFGSISRRRNLFLFDGGVVTGDFGEVQA